MRNTVSLTSINKVRSLINVIYTESNRICIKMNADGLLLTCMTDIAGFNSILSRLWIKHRFSCKILQERNMCMSFWSLSISLHRKHNCSNNAALTAVHWACVCLQLFVDVHEISEAWHIHTDARRKMNLSACGNTFMWKAGNATV